MSDSSGPPAASIRQRELLARRAEFRLQGVPHLRRSPRATRGGGFGNPIDNPTAWTLWFQVDGLWRQLESERGLPREWTSLDRAARWLAAAGFENFFVSGADPNHPNALSPSD